MSCNLVYCQISILRLQARLAPFLCLSFCPACLFFSLVCTCVPPVLSLNMSVCVPSPHWYALPPSTLSLTLPMIIFLVFQIFLSFCLSSCLIVAFFVYLCFSLSSAQLFCICCFFHLCFYSPTPLFLLLPRLLLLLLFTAFTESQGEEK